MRQHRARTVSDAVAFSGKERTLGTSALISTASARRVVGYVGGLFAMIATITLGAAPASAEVRYTADDEQSVARAAAQLSLRVDDFHVAAASVHHFLLGLSGALATPGGGCGNDFAALIDAGTGDYAHASVFLDNASLDAVSAHYCIEPPQAHRINAALLTFLVGLEPAPPAVVTLAPPGAGTPVALQTGVTPTGALFTAGRYTTQLTARCEVRRLGTDLVTELASISGESGEQLVVDVSASDGGLDIGSGCGSWFRVDASTPPVHPDTVIPPGHAIVGVDVAPGTYESETDGVCAIARLGGFGGTFGELLATDLYSSGDRAVVTIDASDAGFASTTGCGVWTAVG